MIERLFGWYRSWRFGGITGQNLVESNAKMTSIVALPWLVGYLFCFMFVPDPFLEPSIIMMSIVWIFYCYGIYSYAKVDATSYRPFPQSIWKFPDGGSRKYNLMIRPDAWSKECDFKDGEQGWRVDLGRHYQYWDNRSDFPFRFNHALLKLDAKPDECFSFSSEGEFFHKGIAIKHPACEDLSVHIYGWLQDENGEYYPVGAVNDCSLSYVKALESEETHRPSELRKANLFEVAYRTERRRRMMLQRHADTMEDIVDSDEKDARDFRKEVKRGISTRRDLFEHIVDTKPPLMQRIKGTLWKIALGVILIVAFLWFIGWI